MSFTFIIRHNSGESELRRFVQASCRRSVRRATRHFRHSFAGHFIALLLLEIPQLAKLYGEDLGAQGRGKPALNDVMSANYVFKGPLLWLGDRLGKNRERAGLHYLSDSLASRWLAGALWKLLTTGPDATAQELTDATPPAAHAAGNDVTGDDLINCPSLRHVLRMSKAEWAV